MSSRSLIHLCLTGFFALAVLWVVGSWSTWAKNQEVMLQFLAILVIAVAGGFFLILVVLPRFGDAVGTAIMASGAEVEEDRAAKAQALIARGDHEGAIEEYEKVLAANPGDSFAVSEMAKICSEKLGDPVRGLHILRRRLEGQEWPADDAAFLMFRMADIHVQEETFADARQLLEHIANSFPETRHSANARHKINEVEQAEFKAAHAQRARGGLA